MGKGCVKIVHEGFSEFERKFGMDMFNKIREKKQHFYQQSSCVYLRLVS
jgi:hypothetical protein